MSRDPFHGDSRRDRAIYLTSPLGPWRGHVTVTPVLLPAGPAFEVHATWHGPPQIGFPPDHARGDRSDTIMVGHQELAVEIARRATDELRDAREVDGIGGSFARLDLRRLHRELVLRDGLSPYVDPSLGAGRPAA